MSDIKASERRLSAALDRIDYLLENAQPRRDAAPAVSDGALQAQLDQALIDNERLQAAIEAMRPALQANRAAGESSDDIRLVELGDQAARLSAANEELVAANRGLIEAIAGETDGVEAVAVALEAEIEALRSARAAEIAQIAEIMTELQRILSDSTAGDAPFASDVMPETQSGDSQSGGAEIVSFGDESGGELGVAELSREVDPGFDAVYGEDDDDRDDPETRGV